MAGEEDVGAEMAASYTVQITGVERTRSELKKLTGLINEIRNLSFPQPGDYSILIEIDDEPLRLALVGEREGARAERGDALLLVLFDTAQAVGTSTRRGGPPAAR